MATSFVAEEMADFAESNNIHQEKQKIEVY